MTDSSEMALILEHYRHPQNHGSLEAPDVEVEDVNPGCGDRIRIQARLRGDTVEEVRFVGDGCVISVAAASILTTLVKGRPLAEVVNLPETEVLRALEAPISPRRYACALLGYQLLRRGLVRHFHEQRVRGG